MELLKDKIIKTIEQMPDNTNVEDIIEKILFISKVESGLEDVINKKTISAKELEEESDKWG